MKRLFIAVLALGCGNGSSDPPPQQQPKPTEDAAVVDTGPPGPRPGDPPACPGEKSPGTAPSPRAEHAGVLDKSGTKLAVFGGDTEVVPCGATASRAHTDETFVLDVGCGTWKPITATPRPSARARHVMTPDPRRDRALVFGGRTRMGATGDYTLLNDLWGLDFTVQTWTKLETSGTAPSPRWGAAAAYDVKRDRVIVFGGDTSATDTTSAPLNDTHALGLQFREWSQLTTTGDKPPARVLHAVAIDDESSKLYVFGGTDPNQLGGPFFNDLWALDLASNAWSKLPSTGDAPDKRIQLGMSFDPIGKQLVVFGGRDDKLGSQNDVHLFNLATNTWTRLNTGDTFKSAATGACSYPADYTTIDKLAPERRSAFAFAPSLDGLGFIVHAGRSDCGLVADTLWFNVLNEEWFPIATATAGHSCTRNSDACTELCK